MLILGVICLIAAISYFMSGSEAIKDGKYANEHPRYYLIISKNRVQFWFDQGNGTFIKALEFDIAKSDMKTTIDGKERVVYVSTRGDIPIYIAQSPSGVLYFYKLIDGSLVEINEEEGPTNLKKVD
jgi:hypothetical protein